MDQNNGLWIFHQLMGTISNFTLFEAVPLDIALHLFFGVYFIYLFRKSKYGAISSFALALGLSLFKEWIDSYSLTASLEESIQDVLATLFFPLLNCLSELIKQAKSKRKQHGRK